MKARILIAAMAIWSLGAHNDSEGEYHPRGQGGGTAGVGGNIIILPNGPGGFGDMPPEPQDASDKPDCNSSQQASCEDKCRIDYEAEGAKCGEIENEAQRKACQDAAYEVFKSCRQSCAKISDCLEDCKEQCDQLVDKCKGLQERPGSVRMPG